MKNAAILLFFLLCCNASYAQNLVADRVLGAIFSGARISILGGYSFSTIAAKVDDSAVSERFNSGFHIGIKTVSRPSRFGIETGLVFSTTGGKYNYRYSESQLNYNNIPVIAHYNLEQNIKTYNFIFPLDFKHRFGSERWAFFFGYGLFFSAGIEGKFNTTGGYLEEFDDGSLFIEEYDETIEDNTFHPYDFGFSFMTGVEFNSRIHLRLKYNHGLLNQGITQFNQIMYKYHIQKTEYKNRLFLLSLEWVLGPTAGNE